MKTTAFWHWLMPIFVLGFVFSFAFTATAQNYYPAHIGNEWVLESTNGKERRTYTLEKPEDAADEEFILLKIKTEQIDTGDIVDTDKYFLTFDDEAIKLHKTVLRTNRHWYCGNCDSRFSNTNYFFPSSINARGEMEN